MGSFQQSMEMFSTIPEAETILRFAPGEQIPASNRNDDVTRRGQAALDLVHQVADTISQTENRIETLLVRALDQLRTAEDRNGTLSARAVAAEARAREAEKWLRRLHAEMEAKLGARGDS